MTITLSAFRWVPEFAQGFVRDLRVRWALEEAGADYQVDLVDMAEMNTPEYRHWPCDKQHKQVWRITDHHEQTRHHRLEK